ncbi:hypothetical protein [Streptomyces sp. NPDC006368]|uniref:hypothetical protein n=1 Tax=Streptomyces sp. NPDC006368 TaxID=3156760 RepID=UPI0033B89A70
MSETPFDPDLPHTDELNAEALNDAIRELWARSGGQLSADEQRIYQALVVAWARAHPGDVAKAA